MSENQIDLPPHGFVRLVDRMGDDSAICRAARTSYGPGTKTISDDRTLIRYLMRHYHTTPFEFVQFTFHAKLPIFVARQWMRARSSSYNEQSARYTEMKDEFFTPIEWRKQSKTNKQGGEETIDADQQQGISFEQHRQFENDYDTYEILLNAGVSREMARIVLPVSLYTEFYWSVNLHNLFHFLKLRMESHAQKEIRDYANALFEIIKPVVPIACEAFVDYRLEAMTLTRVEIEAIRTEGDLKTENKREIAEFEEKRNILFFGK